MESIVHKDTRLAFDKGIYSGSCNRTACQKPNSATFYNHSTEKYYCKSCAMLINDANRISSEELFGHELCTEGRNEEPAEFTKLVEEGLLKKEEKWKRDRESNREDVSSSIPVTDEPTPSYKVKSFEPATKKQKWEAVRVVPVRTEPKIDRNSPCSCGSGKKYKKCCLKK